MSTNTVPTTLAMPASMPVWDYCPHWCDETEHSEAIAGRPDTRTGDDARVPHERYVAVIGDDASVGVSVRKPSCHLVTAEEFRAMDRRSIVRLSIDGDLMLRDESDEDDVVLSLDPARARSLAAALVRAADVIESRP